jgi:WD40 repeat protein
MADSSSSSNVNIGSNAKGIIAQTVTGSTFIELQQIITPEAIKQIPFQARSPYKALKRFDVDDKEYYFGRYEFTLQLQAAIKTNNLILVLGASGSGKSSVVRAKLIPEFLGPGINNHSFILTPKNNPFQSLYESLIGRDKIGPDKDYRFSEAKTEFVLDGNSDVLTQVISQLKDKDPQESEWIIFIDQFEEIFTRCNDLNQRKNFIKSLTQIAKSENKSVKIVLAMRADFLEKISPYPHFGEIIQRNIHLVTDMHEDDLKLAIKGPAAKHGVKLEDGLATEIIQDVKGQAGSLPLLQYTLDLLWRYEYDLDKLDGRNDGLKDRTLNIKNYRDLGKVRGALTKHINKIYKDMDKGKQDATKQIFLSLVKLVEAEGILTPVSQSIYRAALDDKILQEVVDQLIDESLLVSSNEDLEHYSSKSAGKVKHIKQATVEIAHEILLSSWPELGKWIEQAASVINDKSRLIEEMNTWLKTQKDGDLLKGSLLEKVLEHQKENMFRNGALPLSKAEEDFIKRSVKAKERELRRARRIAITTGGVGLVMTGLAMLLGVQLRQAEVRQIQTLQKTAEANRLSGEDLDAWINILRSSSMLKNSFWQKLMPSQILNAQILGEFYEISYAAHEFNRLEGHEAGVNDVDFSPDEQHLATTSNDGTARIWNVKGNEIHILKDHKDATNCVHYHPSGESLVTCSDDGTAKIWDANGGLVETFSHGDQVGINNVTYSPDGKYIATSATNGNAYIWNTNGEKAEVLSGHKDGGVESVVYRPKHGDQLATYGVDGTARLWNTNGTQKTMLTGHTGPITRVGYSPSGNHVVTGGWDGTARIWEWDTDGKEPVAVLTGHEGAVWRVVYSPDETQLATAGEDGTVRLWDTNGKQLVALTGHEGFVNRLMYSPDGKQIATGGEDGTVRIWDTNAYRLITEIRGNKGSINSVTFSPDGKYLVTCGGDGTIRFYGLSDDLDAASYRIGNSSPDGKNITFYDKNDNAHLWGITANQEIKLKGYQGTIVDINYSHDGKYITVYDENDNAHLWNITANQEVDLKGHQGAIKEIDYSHDGKYITIYDENENVHLWDIPANREIQLKGYQGAISRIFYSPSSKYITVDDGNGQDGSLYSIWDVNANREIQLKGYQGGIYSVLYSPDDKYMHIYDGYNENPHLWDITANQEIQLKDYQGAIREIEYSPDSKYITFHDENENLHLWDITTNQEIDLKGYQGDIKKIEYSPNSKYITFHDENENLHLWDILTSQEIKPKDYQGAIKEIEYSPDSKYITIVDENKIAHLWEITASREIKLKGYQGTAKRIVHSPKGNYLVVITQEGNTYILDAMNKQVIAQLKGHQGFIDDVEFSPDEQYLTTYGRDSTVQIQSIDGLDKMMERGCLWVKDYLASNSKLAESDKHICDDVEPSTSI